MLAFIVASGDLVVTAIGAGVLGVLTPGMSVGVVIKCCFIPQQKVNKKIKRVKVVET